MHAGALMWGKKKKNEAFTPFRDAGDMPAPPVPIHQPPSERGPLAPVLKELVRKRLMTDMLRGFTADDMGAVMLVDKLTVRILSSAYKLSELLEENINLVENITAKDAEGRYMGRQPMPNITACYFITPTVESINRMLADYKDKKSPMYGKCHIFLSSRLSDALLAKIKAHTITAALALALALAPALALALALAPALILTLARRTTSSSTWRASRRLASSTSWRRCAHSF